MCETENGIGRARALKRGRQERRRQDESGKDLKLRRARVRKGILKVRATLTYSTPLTVSCIKVRRGEEKEKKKTTRTVGEKTRRDLRGRGQTDASISYQIYLRPPRIIKCAMDQSCSLGPAPELGSWTGLARLSPVFCWKFS